MKKVDDNLNFRLGSRQSAGCLHLLPLLAPLAGAFSSIQRNSGESARRPGTSATGSIQPGGVSGRQVQVLTAGTFLPAPGLMAELADAPQTRVKSVDASGAMPRDRVRVRVPVSAKTCNSFSVLTIQPHHHQHTSPEGNLPPTATRNRYLGYARRASWAKASLPDRQSSQGVVGEGRQEEKQTSDQLTQLTVCNDPAGRGKPGGTGNTPPLAADNAAPASFSWTGAQRRGERGLDVVWRRRPPAKGNLQDWGGAKALQSSRS